MASQTLAPSSGERVRRLPRDLHPGAWWLWSIGLAAAATFTWNPFLLLLIVAVAWLVVVSRRTDAPWALSFRFYITFGLVIVAIRVLMVAVFGPAIDGPTVLWMPQIPLPSVARGITLFGPLTVPELLYGLYNGLRLAAMIICVGAANSLANPKRLLAHVPPALYEAGTMITVALAIFPQLVESVQRVHRARRLRGEPSGRVNGLKRIVVPVLEDALERSMTLAAGMDARGYGRTAQLGRRARLVNGAVMLGSLGALTIGAYGYLDATAPRWMAWPMLATGLVGAALGFRFAGRRVARTTYRPDRWRLAEVLTVLCGFAAAFGVDRVSHINPYAVVPDYVGIPDVPVAAVIAILIAALPAVITPEPRALQ